MLEQSVDFDAFAATIDCSEGQIIAQIQSQIDLSETRAITPKYGYSFARQVYRGEQHFAEVYWGSESGGTHIRHEGENAPLLRSILVDYAKAREFYLSPTRIDSRVDWVEEGLYDKLSGLLQSFAIERDLKIGQMGDWVRGKNRTLYIGSRQSECFVRFYEKGCKMGGDPNWVRYEVELKPRKRPQRERALQMSAEEILFTKWSGIFLQGVGWAYTPQTDYPSVYEKSDDARARKHLIKQYGKIISRWKDDAGTWSNLGLEIQKEIESEQTA